MALNSGKILMRRGQEVNFDPNKMTPGEWAVSLDSKYVRMCFQPGVCVRMATYDAFEADMVQIQKILAECQTVEEAVQRIYEEIKDVAVDVERIETAAANALKSEQNALNSANSASQSAETAIQKAEESAESANIASTKAEQATEGANTATQKASEAAESADNVRNMSDVSQSYAVGGTGTREGEDTDNAKYYNQQASDNADRAEAAAERASSVADVGVATTEKAGLVKPDGETIRVDLDGTIHADRGTTSYTDLENKPKINDVVLEGEKTLEELGIASKEALEKTDSKVNIIIEHAELRFKETASGENIHLDDSADSKLVEFGLYGKAVQNGEPTPEAPIDIEVSGESYNLLEHTATSQTINGVGFVANDDGSIMANGTATSDVLYRVSLGANISANKEYIISGCPSGGNTNTYTLRVTDGLTTAYDDVGNGIKFSYSDLSKFEVMIRIKSGVKVENLIFKPMIRKASVSNDRYMPYGVGSVEVKSVGKNLLPYPYDRTTKTENGITWTDNGDGSITANGIATANSTFYLYLPITLPKGSYILSDNVANANTHTQVYLFDAPYTTLATSHGTKMFTLEEETALTVRINVLSGQKVENLTFKPMIRLASVSNGTWEPYKSKTVVIPTENGLAGIPVDSGGNYTGQNGQQWICDEVIKYADGSGEYVQRVGKTVFDGSADEVWNTSVVGTVNRFFIMVSDSKSDSARNLVVCSHGIFTTEHFSGASFISSQHFYLYNGLCASVEEYKTWLQENNVTVYYELAEPISTPLTPEQLAEIEKLSTFYSVTNMSNDFDCGMKLKYIADAKSYIDNRLALIEQAMLNSI